MLETIREFALERLVEAGERVAMEAAHAQHFLGLAETLEPHLSVGPSHVPSVDRLGRELDNLHAALTEFDDSGRGEELLRLATALWRFWMARGYFGIGMHWLERGLLGAVGAATTLRARGLEALGATYALAGQLDQSDSLTTEALALFRSLDDRRGVSETLNNLALTAWFRGEHRYAGGLLEEALSVAQSAGNTYLTALATHNLASIRIELGDKRLACGVPRPRDGTLRAAGRRRSVPPVRPRRSARSFSMTTGTRRRRRSSPVVLPQRMPCRSASTLPSPWPVSPRCSRRGRPRTRPGSSGLQMR